MVFDRLYGCPVLDVPLFGGGARSNLVPFEQMRGLGR
jgi:hypothetical protein